MPAYKSKSHKAKIESLEAAGKIKKGTSEKWASETKGKLPQRLTPKQPKSIQEIKELRVKKFGK